MNIDLLRFPIGEFEIPTTINNDDIDNWRQIINDFPNELSELTQDLSPIELNYRYRPKGWNIQQLVHHCADSHMNGFIRHKLTLSEDCPTIKPYLEAKWAEMDDVKLPISESLAIIEGVHARWSVVLNSLSEADLSKEYIHPELGMNFTLYQSIANYAWHCEHHLAHIKKALESKSQLI